MKRIAYLFALLALAVAIGCGESTEKETAVEAPPVDEKQLLLDSIAELENSLKNVQKIGQRQSEAFAVVSCYKLFADKYRDDARAAEYLFRGGDVAVGLKQYTLALHFYERIYKDFPDYDKRPMALFLQAFIKDSYMKDFEEARALYEQCIEEFPNDRVAEDSKGALEFLGLSEEELIERLKEKNS